MFVNKTIVHDVTNFSKEVETNEEAGEAFATSVLSSDHKPSDAFRRLDSVDDIHWSSDNVFQANDNDNDNANDKDNSNDNVSQAPIFLWFRFKEKKKINKIAFKENSNATGETEFQVSEKGQRWTVMGFWPLEPHVAPILFILLICYRKFADAILMPFLT